MSRMYIPADDFKIGDLIDIGDGQVTEVRAIQRGDVGLLIVNPGDFDEITGRIWNHAHVTRPDTEGTDPMTNSETRYTVNLELPDPWLNASVELLPSEIPRKGELIGWTTEPVRDSTFAEPRTKFLRLRVVEAMWCLNPTTNTDREVYLTLEPDEGTS